MARLRDIQELFMGTGLGPESYAIIEQGRIGQLLSSKPLDRRGIIEEAAGISEVQNQAPPGRSETRRRPAESRPAFSTSSRRLAARSTRSSARPARRSVMKS